MCLILASEIDDFPSWSGLPLTCQGSWSLLFFGQQTFATFHPCGLEKVRTTSLEQALSWCCQHWFFVVATHYFSNSTSRSPRICPIQDGTKLCWVLPHISVKFFCCPFKKNMGTGLIESLVTIDHSCTKHWPEFMTMAATCCPCIRNICSKILRFVDPNLWPGKFAMKWCCNESVRTSQWTTNHWTMARVKLK